MPYPDIRDGWAGAARRIRRDAHQPNTGQSGLKRHQIFTGLLGVKLILCRQDDQIILQVSDSGIGISPEDQTHIFETSFRSGQVNNISGTGLGLSIVRECVEAHRGTILVESELGKGTTFTVSLQGKRTKSQISVDAPLGVPTNDD